MRTDFLTRRCSYTHLRSLAVEIIIMKRAAQVLPLLVMSVNLIIAKQKSECVRASESGRERTNSANERQESLTF